MNERDDKISDGDEVEEALDLNDNDQLTEALDRLHPADFADQFEQLSPEEQREIADRAPDVFTSEILNELEDEVVEDIVPRLPSEHLAEALSDMDSDDATQILEEMEDAQRDEVLDAIEPVERAALKESLAFDDETIGRLMQRQFVAAPEFWTVGDALDHMRDTGQNLPDLFFNVYIVDLSFKPIGYVPVSTLLRQERHVQMRDLMVPTITTITENLDQEEAAFYFEKYNLISAPVVNDDGRLVGMMTVDDIVRIIQDENTEDILALAGVSEAGITDTPIETVRARAPWLFVNLLTAVLASIVIAQFDYAITEIVALAVLMPIVASMGGNAGTQALTVAVRALAERELTSKSAWRAVRRETIAAFIIGLIFAVALAIIAFVWFRDPQLALVAFIAMMINHAFAGVAGISVPLLLKRYGADPAVASSVFVTTVTDIVGFFAFLGTAVLMLL